MFALLIWTFLIVNLVCTVLTVIEFVVHLVNEDINA
jgi:hypothetical protein